MKVFDSRYLKSFVVAHVVHSGVCTQSQELPVSKMSWWGSRLLPKYTVEKIWMSKKSDRFFSRKP